MPFPLMHQLLSLVSLQQATVNKIGSSIKINDQQDWPTNTLRYQQRMANENTRHHHIKHAVAY